MKLTVHAYTQSNIILIETESSLNAHLLGKYSCQKIFLDMGMILRLGQTAQAKMKIKK